MGRPVARDLAAMGKIQETRAPGPMEERVSETLEVEIWRGRARGRYETYRVPARATQTVLDVVTEVQRRHAPDLAYRFACRVGVCGSCAMTVNGRPRWTCRSHVRRVAPEGRLRIAPLANMPVIKDLVADMAGFFEKWTAAGGAFEGRRTRHDPPMPIDPASPGRRRADAALQCINCGICYAACDVVAARPDYLGPAALNRAWTLVNDARAANRTEVRGRALEAGGCGACHSHGACMAACPLDLSPTASIAGLKRMSLWQLLGGG